MVYGAVSISSDPRECGLLANQYAAGRVFFSLLPLLVCTPRVIVIAPAPNLTVRVLPVPVQFRVALHLLPCPTLVTVVWDQEH